MSKSKSRTQAKKKRRVNVGSGPLGFYVLVLVMTLVAALVLQLVLAAALPLLDAEVVSQPLNGLFALFYAWLLGGLVVSGLLMVWLRPPLKIVGIVLSLLAAALWVLGLWRHLRGPSIVLYLLPLPGGGAAFWAGLRYASRHVLPISSQAEIGKAFDFVKEHIAAGSQRTGVIDGGDGSYRSDKGVPDHQPDKPAWNPAFVLTGCDRTVAIADKFRLEDVRDPGLIFLRPDERIAQVIDLRPQRRTFSVTARTQDGIQVRVQASVAFRIDAGRRRPQLGGPLPFNRAAAFKAIHAQRVEHGGPSRAEQSLRRRLWDDLPAMRGEHILRDIICKVDFDDLCAPHQLDGEPPRRTVSRTLFERLQSAVEPMGIQLIAIDLGNLEPADPEVYLKRARNWQAEWIRRVTLKQAEGQAERLQILERARADARTELIMDVGRQLESLSESDAEVSPDAVLDRFLVVLETLMTRPQLRDALPRRTREVLSDVREVVGE